jgi:hypothetical protein
LHEVTAGVVGDEGVGDAVLGQFPSGEASALVARASFVDPDVDALAGVVSGIDRGGG